MRRNMPRGGQMGRNQGPLITEHLQDLDLELELLKRKRHMMEQQQQLMRTRNFGPGGYNDQRFDNYSYLYEEGPGPSFSSDFGNQLGKRRHNISPWQEDVVPPKHFPISRGKSSRQFDNCLIPRPGDIRPVPQMFGLLNHPPFRPAPGPRRPPPNGEPLLPKVKKPKQKMRRGDYVKPKKVNKTKKTQIKASPAPNKLASLPVEQRKQLVSETLTATAADESLVLSADHAPSQLVTGRLELALGHILKELRLNYSTDETYSVCFANQSTQRIMKQAIRDRIRSVMLGHTVGNVLHILDRYHQHYPPSTDKVILQLVLEKSNTEQAKYDIYTEEADPERYFNVNVHKIIDSTLHEMFNKLQDLYSNVEIRPLASDIRIKSDIKEKLEYGNENKDKPEDGNKNMDKPVDDNEITDNMEDDNENVDKPENNENMDTAEDNENMDKPDVGNTNGDNIAVGNVDEANGETTNETKPSIENPEESMLTDVELKEEKPDLSKLLVDKKPSDTSTAVEVINLTIKNPCNTKRIPRVRRSNESELFIQSVIKRKMPQMLQKYIPHIIKLLNLNHMYKTATADIYNNTIHKIASMPSPKASPAEKASPNENPKPVEKPVNSITMDITGEIKYTLPPPKYYVKVIARPSLPKRKMMQTFLDQFHPRTIKKHKKVHGLLFVGFVDKDDFDNILKASGSTIGRSTLDIKVSDWSKGKDKLNEGDEANDTIESVDLDQSAVSELNDQIDDLLSAIRKADENEKVDSNCIKTEVDDGNMLTEGDGEVNDENPSKEIATENVEKTEIDNVLNEENNDTAADVPEKVNEVLSNITEETETDIKSEVIETVNKVEALKDEAKESGRSTPTRASARLNNATPSTIRTRRASRLAQN